MLAPWLARVLNLRDGEGRPLAILGGYLFLASAAVTVVAAAQNGLFLSVYPGALIPHAVIAAALVTASVAVVFAGMISGTARRGQAAGLTVTLAAVLLASRGAFAVDPRTTFALYLVLAAVQVLLLTHAWDYAGDLLTGRQAKRLMPLIGVGASTGALLGGVSLAPVALLIGTPNTLVVGAALMVAGIPLLWMLPEPDAGRGGEAPSESEGVAAFLDGASRGFRSIGREPLLRVMAGGVLLLALVSTLIELQYKLALQETFSGNQITAVYGLMAGLVGAGTVVVQLAASRFLFPRLGVSFAARLHAGTLALGALGAVMMGGFVIRAALQVLDDVLYNALQKPVEQVSLLPFSGPVKRATVATLGGVVQPLSRAAGGGLAILLASQGRLLALATVMAAAGAFALAARHRRLYLSTLEAALSRHAVDFRTANDRPLLADRQALSVVDRGLADDDAMVVVFSLSLLEQLPEEDALPRAVGRLDHPSPEVRAEAARLIGRLDPEDSTTAREQLRTRLSAEGLPFVLAAVLDSAGRLGGSSMEEVDALVNHTDERVRRAALVARAKLGGQGTEEDLRSRLRGASPLDRAAAAGAVGELGLTGLTGEVAAVVEDDHARPAALAALAALGPAAVPVLAGLLERRALALPLRRSVVTTLAGIGHADARNVLLDLVDEPALGPPALTSLRRLRSEGALAPVEPGRVRPLLEAEVCRGYRYALASKGVRDGPDLDPGDGFLAHELEGLRVRALHRCLRILSLSFEPARLETVQAGLLSDDPQRMSNALELLEGILDRDTAGLAVPFAETCLEEVTVERAQHLLPEARSIVKAPLEALCDDTDWWPRALALHALGRYDDISIPGRDPGADEETLAMIPLIERVMILKGSQLFRYFPGSDLAGIAALAEVVHLEEGDMVFQQNDPGDAFYVVVQGGVRISRGSHHLATLGPREGFGEMALLDQQPRSATAEAAESTTLLKLDRDAFDRLIEQNPSVARGIYRVLTQRLRSTLAQVAAG